MIQELTWDTELFGRKIGRIEAVPREEELTELFAQANKQQFRYLTCRVRDSEISTVQLLEKYGFYLTDIGVVWERGVEVTEEPRIPAKDATIEDIETIRAIASGLFKDSRFYHDPFFTKEEADRLYQAWAENLLKGFADKVFLIGSKGFISCKASGDAGEISLIGVAALYQGKGIGAALVLNALKWFKEIEAAKVTVRTQASNIKSMRFYQHLGFKLKTIDITVGKILAL